MINNRLIAQIRTTMNKFYTDTCSVKGLRGSPRALGTVYASMPCRLVPANMAGLSSQDEILMQNTSFVLEYPYNYTLIRDDEITHNNDGYRVVDIVQDMTPITHHKAMLERVKIT